MHHLNPTQRSRESFTSSLLTPLLVSRDRPLDLSCAQSARRRVGTGCPLPDCRRTETGLLSLAEQIQVEARLGFSEAVERSTHELPSYRLPLDSKHALHRRLQAGEGRMEPRTSVSEVSAGAKPAQRFWPALSPSSMRLMKTIRPISPMNFTTPSE